MSFRNIPGGPRKWRDAEFNSACSMKVLTQDLDVYMAVTGFREAVACGKTICGDLMAIGTPYSSTGKMSDDQRLFRSAALLIAGHVISCGGVPESDFVYETLGGRSPSPGKRIKKELSIICDRLPAVRSAFCTKGTDGLAITVREYVVQGLHDAPIDKDSFAADTIIRLKAQYHTMMVQKIVCIVLDLLHATKATFGGKTSNNHIRHAVYFLLTYVLRNYDPSKQTHFKSRKMYDDNTSVFSKEFARFEEQVLALVTWMHNNLTPGKRPLLALSLEDVAARRAVLRALADVEDDELELEMKKQDEELDAILAEQLERKRELERQELERQELERDHPAEAAPDVDETVVTLPIPTCCFTSTRYDDY